MNHLLLAAEIVSGTIAGLILMAVAMATVRALLGDKAPAWGVQSVATAEAKAAAEGWIHRALVAFDIAVNVIILRGQQDETISAHSWRAVVEGKTWGRWMTQWLDWIQPFHGQKAAAGDLERAQVRVAVLSKALGVSPNV
jgi:hypothetical protein